MLISIKEAAQLLGVSPRHLRDSGHPGLEVIHTTGGHRRYNKLHILEILGQKDEKSDVSNKVAVYSRVSSHDQKVKGDLDRQKLRNIEYCLSKNYEIVVTFEECASGMNDKRPKLRKLIELAQLGKFSKVIVEHRDRLTRFNFYMYEFFFKQLGVEVICTSQSLEKTFEAELVEDMLSLIQSFGSKINGKRSAKNKSERNKLKIK